ncbi:BRCT domain-containing protein At4g02110-like [Solanum dulcamara]|uniref:BRCT domain-containing protein At4g02110-like n=1 Tax=Solanum dulcamara TaxID=45834 RepID=UPI002485C25F|nr:BRCT domain-containing protein At4g02110-like [Solanum dulcamara]
MAESEIYGDPSKIFNGIRFVLAGFDSPKKEQVTSKLLEAGGVDVSKYGPDCTHLIVDRTVYDDPLCVAARRDGKFLVTGLWVEHSFDVGMPVDHLSIMYRPPRDLTGIPGAKSLILCLTGYQRQDRDDIMIMVGLMGANFLKPLVANKVTHLICYKFEGEKYELAKKMKKIKLVNHLWLEDCLRAWEILPEASYDKSGYELEMMEAEAKDSEDEQDEIAAMGRERVSFTSPQQSKSPNQFLLKEEISRNTSEIHTPIGLSDLGNNKHLALCAPKESKPDLVTTFGESHKRHLETLGTTVSRNEDVPLSMPQNGNSPTSVSNNARKSPKSCLLNSCVKSYSQEKPIKIGLTIATEQVEKAGCPVSNEVSQHCDNLNISSEKEQNGTEVGSAKFPTSNMSCLEKGQSDVLHEKRRVDMLYNGSPKTSHNPESMLDGDLAVKSYSQKKPRKIGLTMALEQIESAGCSPANEVSQHCDNLNISSEKEQDGTGVGSAKIPTSKMSCLEKGQSGVLPEKRRVQLHNSSPTTSHNPESMVDSDLMEDCGEELGRHLSLRNNIQFGKGASLDPLQKCDSSISTSIIHGNQQECDEDALQAGTCAVMGLRKTALSSNVDPVNVHSFETEHSTGDHNGPRNELQAVKNPSPGNKREDVEKSIRLAELENAVGNTRSGSKPLKIKSLPKKTLESGLSLCESDARNQEGTTFHNKTVPANDSAPSVSWGRQDRDHQEVLSFAKVEIPPAGSVESSKETEKRKYLDSGKEDVKTAESINDDAETPESKECDELNVLTGEVPQSLVKSAEKLVVNADGTDVEDCAVMHDVDDNNSEAQKTISGNNTRSNKSTSAEDDVDVKITKGSKYLMKRRKTTNLAAKRAVISRKEAKRKKSENDEKKNVETENGEGLPVPGEQTVLALDHELNSMDLEKENRPLTQGQSTSYNEHGAGKSSPKCDNKKPLKADVANTRSLQVTKVGTEPRWFILSGHRLLRKEFEKVIKRLKGNVCRDSHQWSYQATHFIVPDPIRRTEKLFAAAASGRWILKSDYLTASNEAGRLLDEEKYEWHKKGLTEDLAIDLEAPRKWRLLRERTGHGAFYGMKIIIYGDCIVPPLDTLKRAVKAGDGTILATSPPYTRFLKSGVNFAVVDETMPHYDTWVQEFLRCEIPCILADYLVAYVCKPGYPCDSYVQYNTHTWVERSLKNLADRLEEVVEDMLPSDDNSKMEC